MFDKIKNIFLKIKLFCIKLKSRKDSYQKMDRNSHKIWLMHPNFEHNKKMLKYKLEIGLYDNIDHWWFFIKYLIVLTIFITFLDKTFILCWNMFEYFPAQFYDLYVHSKTCSCHDYWEIYLRRNRRNNQTLTIQQYTYLFEQIVSTCVCKKKSNWHFLLFTLHEKDDEYFCIFCSLIFFGFEYSTILVIIFIIVFILFITFIILFLISCVYMARKIYNNFF